MSNINIDELRYLAIYSTLKRIYEKGEIDKNLFRKLNNSIAEIYCCKAITV